MTNSKKYYVYIHYKKSDGKPFYVGKGKGKRAYWIHGRSQYWNRVKNKHGLQVEIFKSGLTESESHALEMELIREIGIKNLCNSTEGGEGMSGWRPSEKTRKKIGDRSRGRRHTKEAREKMSNSRKNVPKSKEHVESQAKSMKGKEFSEEHRKNLSEALKKVKVKPEWGIKSGKARMYPVICINNGVEYESTRDAAYALGVDKSSVSRVCTGKYKHTQGYIFRYKNDENT